MTMVELELLELLGVESVMVVVESVIVVVESVMVNVIVNVIF